jgi:predicted Zn-dependent protease
MGQGSFKRCAFFALLAFFLTMVFDCRAIALPNDPKIPDTCRKWRGNVRWDISECIAIIEGRRHTENLLDLVSAYFFRGQYFRILNRKAEAIADFSSALLIRPRFSLAQAWRGMVWKELDNCELAYPDLVAGVRGNPRYESLLIDAAICAYKLKKFENAIELSRAAIVQNRRNPVPRMNLASTYLAMGSLREALKAYDEALARPVRIEQPDISRVHVQKGIIYIALNELELALQSYTRAIQHDPNNRNAYIRRAYLHAHMGRNELAEADLMSANRTSAK